MYGLGQCCMVSVVGLAVVVAVVAAMILHRFEPDLPSRGALGQKILVQLQRTCDLFDCSA